MELLEEIHPGEILQEEFLRLELSVRRLARDLDVPPSRISELIHGRRPITPDTALRLGLFFQQDPPLLAPTADGVRSAPVET